MMIPGTSAEVASREPDVVPEALRARQRFEDNLHELMGMVECATIRRMEDGDLRAVRRLVHLQHALDEANASRSIAGWCWEDLVS